MYCKLFTSLYQGTLRGKSDEILVFTNLLAHCDAEGFVDKHWRAISEETGLPEDRVKVAITALESPDSESRSPEEEGRRITRINDHRAWGWRVTNYVKYREIRNEADRRTQNREAQRRWRQKKKAGVSQDKPSVSTNKQSKPMQKQYADAEAKVDAGNASLQRPKGFPEFLGYCVGPHCGISQLKCEHMWNTYEANGWTINGIPISNWKAAANKWKTGESTHGQRNNISRTGNQEAGTRNKSTEVESGKISIPILNPADSTPSTSIRGGD